MRASGLRSNAVALEGLILSFRFTLVSPSAYHGNQTVTAPASKPPGFQTEAPPSRNNACHNACHGTAPPLAKTAMTARTIIFDLDGTLVDTAPDLIASPNCLSRAE